MTAKAEGWFSFKSVSWSEYLYIGKQVRVAQYEERLTRDQKYAGSIGHALSFTYILYLKKRCFGSKKKYYEGETEGTVYKC